MGESRTSHEAITASAEILGSFDSILAAREGESGPATVREFGGFEVRRTIFMVGPGKNIPKRSYELIVNAGNVAENHRYSYHQVGQHKEAFIDGQVVELETGEQLLREAIVQARNSYEASDEAS